MEIEYIGKCLIILDKKKGERGLVIGDIHLGYESELEGKGISIGRKMYEEMVEELEKIFDKIGDVNKIILLGDVKHGFSRGNSQEWEEVRRLIEYFNGKIKLGGEIVILKGNHDNYLENIIGRKIDEIIGKETRVEDYYIWREIVFVHGDRDFEEIWNKDIKLVIIGHVHPVVNLNDNVKVEKYKCYMLGEIRSGLKKKKIIVVPSFIENERGVDVREISKEWPWKYNIDNFEIKVIGDNLEVLDFGKIKKL